MHFILGTMASLLATLARQWNSFMRLPQSSASFTRTFVHLRPLINQDSQETLSLLPKLPLVSQICGFKVKYKLRKRCKDCYLVVRDQRTYVICPTHPRHKQMTPVKKPKYSWILTHAAQSKIRPW